MTNGDRLKVFSDAEIYIIKRAMMDSSFATVYSELYTENHKQIHRKLLVEFATEDTARLDFIRK